MSLHSVSRKLLKSSSSSATPPESPASVPRFTARSGESTISAANSGPRAFADVLRIAARAHGESHGA